MKAAWAGFLALPCLLVVAWRPAADEPPWEEVFAAKGVAPQPLEQLTWRTDLAAALAEAEKSARPLFVTLRCLPCKQCADFDAAVLEGGSELTPLLRQFVTVRLTDAAGLDLTLLPGEGFQDFDMSWWGYLLSHDRRLYAVFGGRDDVSDTTRISVPALMSTLQRVLRHHYDPRRAAWDVDRAPAPREPRLPASLPGYASWTKQRPNEGAECLHCHQVAEILRQPAVDGKTFDKQRDFDVWPLPENVGLELERDDGLRVRAVRPGSPAARAGLHAGDVLGAAEGQRLFGQADFRGVLHRGPRDAGSVRVHFERASAVHAASLELAPGWRKTVLDWRMSVSQGNVGAYPGFWPLPGPRAGKGTLSIKVWYGPDPDVPDRPAYAAGLRQGDEIVAVGGEQPDLVGRAFLVWFRLRHDPGDEVVFEVRSGRGTREVRYRLR